MIYFEELKVGDIVHFDYMGSFKVTSSNKFNDGEPYFIFTNLNGFLNGLWSRHYWNNNLAANAKIDVKQSVTRDVEEFLK
jgi:hypothetical protein